MTDKQNTTLPRNRRIVILGVFFIMIAAFAFIGRGSQNDLRHEIFTEVLGCMIGSPLNERESIAARMDHVRAQLPTCMPKFSDWKLRAMALERGAAYVYFLEDGIEEGDWPKAQSYLACMVDKTGYHNGGFEKPDCPRDLK